MPDEQDLISISFQPDGRKVRVPRGTTALEAAIKAGVGVEGPCGGQGTCGKCKVHVLPCMGERVPEAQPVDREALTEDDIRAGLRLACKLRLRADCSVEVPKDTRMYKHLILMTGLESATPPVPNVTTQPVEGPEGFETLVSIGGKPVSRRRGELHRVFGVAIDLGTTTVVCHLVDLKEGTTVESTVAMNPQIPRGDDVISRIKFASSEEGYEWMVSKAREVVNQLIDQACEESGVKAQDIYELAFAGNTCMHHFFFGLPVTALGEAPYLPSHTGPLTVPAKGLGLGINPTGQVYALPVLAGFLGGDATAVALVSALDAYSGTRLAIDIGTNGEIMLVHNGKIYGCTSPAGPAFEGAQISCGMRASTGAISYLRIENGKVRTSVVGGVDPRGITGSGLVDAAAQLLKAGLMDSHGHLKKDDGGGLLRKGPDGLEFLAVPREATYHMKDIVVTQKDIRQLQLAKAAIAAGISMLMGEADLDPTNLDDVYVAGAFGNYIDRHSAMVIGLIPDIDPKKVVSIGNGAAIGAKRALVSLSERARAETIQRKLNHIELATRKEFQDVFMAHIDFRVLK